MATHNSGASTNGVLGGTGGSNLLPKHVAAGVWQKAMEKSIVPGLAQNEPMILGDNVFTIQTKRPAASIVGEGETKPDSEIEYGAKVVRPIKAVVGLEFTLEAILSNPAGVLGALSVELSGALARQVDLAVFHGVEASSGSTITGVEYLNETTNRQALAESDPGVELWAGYEQVVNGNNDFTGFAFDPRLVHKLALARGNDGRRIYPELNMGSALGGFAGLPAAVSKAVSGQADASSDTGVRGFGGDFSALRFGYVVDIPVKRIEYGDPFGNGDLQRRNAVAYLAEVIFGWAILDLDAFVAYDDESAS